MFEAGGEDNGIGYAVVFGIGVLVGTGIATLVFWFTEYEMIIR